MNIELGAGYRIKVQINNDYGNPVTTGSFSLILKRNSDGYYWNEDAAEWQATLISGLDLSHDIYGCWYNDVASDAFLNEGQYTVFFDSASPNITDSFDLNVMRLAEQWSVTAE